MTELSTMGTIFAVIILAFSLVCLGFFIALAIYFDRAKNYANANPSAPISAGTASLMMWFSIIMTLFAAGLLIYGIIYLVRQSSAAKKLKESQMTITTSTPPPPTSSAAQQAINNSNTMTQWCDPNIDCSNVDGNHAAACYSAKGQCNNTKPASTQAQYGVQTPHGNLKTQENSSLGGRIPRSNLYGY